MAKFLSRLFQPAALLFFYFGLASIAPSVTTGQDSSTGYRSVEVVGTGKASAKPDKLVIKGFVSAEDKSAKKVLGKFLKTKKSLEETINPMDFAGVEIEYLESLFNTNLDGAEMMMAAGATSSDGYSLSQPLRIRIEVGEDDKSTLEMLTKLVDAAESVGLTFDEPSNPMMGIVMESSKSSLATGELKDTASIKDEATKQAFANAKAEAEKLAKLAGARLGKVISIQESAVTDGSDPTNAYMNMVMGMSAEAQSNSINRIEITQSLQIKFELTD